MNDRAMMPCRNQAALADDIAANAPQPIAGPNSNRQNRNHQRLITGHHGQALNNAAKKLLQIFDP